MNKPLIDGMLYEHPLDELRPADQDIIEITLMSASFFQKFRNILVDWRHREA